MSFVKNNKFSICYVLYVEESNPASESDKLTSVRTTLHSMNQSSYDQTIAVHGKNKDIHVSACGVSMLNTCTSVGDSFVFSLIEESKDCGIPCSCRVEHIKDPLDDYIENMDKIYFPGKMSFVAQGSDLYYERCLNIAVQNFYSRPKMFSVFTDGQQVDQNHLRNIKNYTDSGQKFYAIAEESSPKNGVTVISSFYYKAYRRNPDKPLLESLNLLAQEEKCEEMIKTPQQINSL